MGMGFFLLAKNIGKVIILCSVNTTFIYPKYWGHSEVLTILVNLNKPLLLSADMSKNCWMKGK